MTKTKKLLTCLRLQQQWKQQRWRSVLSLCSIVIYVCVCVFNTTTQTFLLQNQTSIRFFITTKQAFSACHSWRWNAKYSIPGLWFASVLVGLFETCERRSHYFPLENHGDSELELFNNAMWNHRDSVECSIPSSHVSTLSRYDNNPSLSLWTSDVLGDNSSTSFASSTARSGSPTHHANGSQNPIGL